MANVRIEIDGVVRADAFDTHADAAQAFWGDIKAGRDVATFNEPGQQLRTNWTFDHAINGIVGTLEPGL